MGLVVTCIASCLALSETRFKLVKHLKAVHTGNETGLFTSTDIHALDQQWTSGFRFQSKNPRLPLFTMQSNRNMGILSEPTVPDHTDHQTVLNFAKLTYNAYEEPNNKKWMPVPGWNVSARFGWENTGIRGYLFEDEFRQNLIIVIKGTSLATPVGAGPTAGLDKLNVTLIDYRII
jgi:putative lipase involved disintegration of autophagic bodies